MEIEAKSISRDSVDISICVPTYNRARYLECLLEDLGQQIYRFPFTYEILIGDNCSTDNTSEIARKHNRHLNIVYFKHKENIGAYANIEFLFDSAVGEFVVYLADDDLLVLEAVARVIESLKTQPSISAVFAPWLLHDRVQERELGQFYNLEETKIITRGDFPAALCFILENHIFPEIFIARREARKNIQIPQSNISFIFFIWFTLFLDGGSIIFSKEPFYRSITRYFDDEVRGQAGLEQTKLGWDLYRGGLEYILARFSGKLTIEELRLFRQAIDEFTTVRLNVALRLRTAEGSNWIENYYLANRLRSFSPNLKLPLEYELYRINAALEFVYTSAADTKSLHKKIYVLKDQAEILSYGTNYSPDILEKIRGAAAAIEKLKGDKSFKEISGYRAHIAYVTEAELLRRFP